ncbi:signal recognition particle 14 kDa protein isoform X3 [Hyposmocoma kahamanoa]|nr:signal recognition particle 14 kDa protein isoform X3 [Hyposmocoma kahamanoa]
MFQKARTSGSVTMTMKRYDGRTKPEPRDGKPVIKNPQYKCLVRAQSRSKKISTVIEQTDVETFSTAYSNLLKTSVNGLKRLKKPKKKAMATQ